ncbi:MAG: hypothetical protein WAW03_20145 [Anaerolineae bacterium]|jgi:hypothetical protein|uniref:hypothetical protein n=1 Tax=Candidatus Amarolinea dominans TaxID=3140696 RepID=UPI001DCABF0E|nr:hypothetical protein [Anaerolineae bacterium]MBK7201003.1 hypothetical protein [Anaerolineae bacterium]MBK9093298.1 hypothetical protein [Anaerolineae bacterium]
MDRHDYQIRVQGHLDERWFRWFDRLTLSLTPAGETIITGAGLDQAALHAILNRMRDLGLELISIQRAPAQTEPDQERKPE